MESSCNFFFQLGIILYIEPSHCLPSLRLAFLLPGQEQGWLSGLRGLADCVVHQASCLEDSVSQSWGPLPCTSGPQTQSLPDLEHRECQAPGLRLSASPLCPSAALTTVPCGEQVFVAFSCDLWSVLSSWLERWCVPSSTCTQEAESHSRVLQAVATSSAQLRALTSCSLVLRRLLSAWTPDDGLHDGRTASYLLVGSGGLSSSHC